MAFSMRSAEMKTRIRILKPIDHVDDRRYRNPEYVNIYDDNRTLRCKWVGAFGAEALQAHSLRLKELATVRMRFDPRITGTCIVEKLPLGSEAPDNLATRYEIISRPNDIDGAHKWLEFKVSRQGAAM